MSAVGTGGYAARSPELAALALAVVQPGFEGVRAPDWLRRRLDSGLGGVALFGRNIVDGEQLARLTAQVHEANPQALVAVDEEGGDVTRLEYRTGSSWPGNLALGAVDDVDLTRSVATEIGSALAEVGIDLDYAPDADVNVEASNPVIGVRSFGSDASLVARHTAAWTQGLQSAGVLACAKHFPGHGDTRVDSHLGLPEVDLGADPTTSPALEPFRAAVEAGTAAVMSGHLRVTGLDPRPATLVPAVMTDLLRDHLGFTGLAISDGLEMGAVADTVGLGEGAVLAIVAGVDALCIGGGLAGPDTLDLVVNALVGAVHAGRLSEERLTEAASRVATAAARRDSLRDSATRTPRGSRAGLEAAARALEVSGSPTVRDATPLVLQLSAASNIAVGDETVSGLVTALRRRWPEAQVEQFGPDTLPAAVAARATAAPTERSVWLAVRDAHRFTWMAEVVATVATARPDVVVVDTGWPGWHPAEGIAHVVTRGGSRASGEAVVRLLSGDAPRDRSGGGVRLRVVPPTVLLRERAEPVTQPGLHRTGLVSHHLLDDVDRPLVGLRVVLSRKGFAHHPHLGEPLVREVGSHLVGSLTVGKDQQVFAHSQQYAASVGGVAAGRDGLNPVDLGESRGQGRHRGAAGQVEDHGDQSWGARAFLGGAPAVEVPHREAAGRALGQGDAQHTPPIGIRQLHSRRAEPGGGQAGSQGRKDARRRRNALPSPAGRAVAGRLPQPCPPRRSSRPRRPSSARSRRHAGRRSPRRR